jgi:hypothetical protein
LTGTFSSLLAHGVGSVYESPIPIGAYLAGGAGTVLASFGVRVFSTTKPHAARDRRIAGEKGARWTALGLRVAGVVGLALTLASGAVGGEDLAPLLFWVGFVVGVALLSALCAGAWAAADPWATLEDVYRIKGAEVRSLIPPWWLGPALLYALFWFELVSDSGFENAGIVFVLVVYSLFAFGFRRAFGDRWRTSDPFSILFGFAERVAPFELKDDASTRATRSADSIKLAPWPGRSPWRSSSSLRRQRSTTFARRSAGPAF